MQFLFQFTPNAEKGDFIFKNDVFRTKIKIGLELVINTIINRNY